MIGKEKMKLQFDCWWLNNIYTFRYIVNRSKIVNGFLTERKTQIVLPNWPKPFGDVMPLEAVWKKMAEELSRRNIKATDDDSLWR